MLPQAFHLTFIILQERRISCTNRPSQKLHLPAHSIFDCLALLLPLVAAAARATSIACCSPFHWIHCQTIFQLILEGIVVVADVFVGVAGISPFMLQRHSSNLSAFLLIFCCSIFSSIFPYSHLFLFLRQCAFRSALREFSSGNLPNGAKINIPPNIEILWLIYEIAIKAAIQQWTSQFPLNGDLFMELS